MNQGRYIIHAVRHEIDGKPIYPEVHDERWENLNSAYKDFLKWKEKGFSVDFIDTKNYEGRSKVIAYTHKGIIEWVDAEAQRQLN